MSRAAADISAEIAGMPKLEDECESGDERACDVLSREEEAKRAWLAKLDLPSWGLGL